MRSHQGTQEQGCYWGWAVPGLECWRGLHVSVPSPSLALCPLLLCLVTVISSWDTRQGTRYLIYTHQNQETAELAMLVPSPS